MALNLFQLSENDQSIYYLGQIFGSVGGVLPVGTGGQVFENPIISQIFLTLNTIALAIGAIIVVYTTVVGLMMTAHEGEFLGKKWSGLWVPIRMVIGTACLFPASSGYSIMQIIIMWFIVQGVGAADMVWSAVLKGSRGETVEQGVPTSNASTLSTEMLVTDIFKSLVCQNTMIEAQSLVGIKDTQIKISKKPKPDAFDPNAAYYNMGPSVNKGACGRLVMCKKCTTAGKASCKVCDAQRTALAEMRPILDGYASQVARADIEYIKFYKTPGGEGAAGWIKTYCEKNNITNCCVTPEKNMLGQDVGTCENAGDFPNYIDPDAASTADMNKDELDFIFDWAMPAVFDEPDPEKWGDFIDKAVEGYNNAIQKAIDETKTEPPPETKSDEKEKYGWIAAGAYYYDVIKTTQNNLKETTVSSQVIDPSGGVLPGSVLKNYRNNYNSAQDFLDKISGTEMSTSGSVQTPKAPSKVSKIDMVSKGGDQVVRAFINMLSSNSGLVLKGTSGNAFTNLAAYGQNLLIIAQIVYAVTLVLFAALSAYTALSSTLVLGSGVAAGWALELLKGFFSIFAPAFFAFLAAIVVFGALLGMYIPMVPYIVFTVTVVGWFIAVIEAMVAGPVIAIGLLSPGGQSEVFGRAEPALMIIFNLFLRPSLMVVGLVTAMFLANIIITFVNFGFLHVMDAITNISPGLVESLIFITIYVTIIFTTMNQVFTLIHHIPERILTYIGGQAMQYGEAQAAQAAKQAVESAAGTMAGAMKGGVEGGVGHAEGAARAYRGAHPEKPSAGGAVELGQKPPKPPEGGG